MKNIVVLVSGSGTNLQRILDCISKGEISNACVKMVIADRPCYGLERAKQAGIEAVLIPRGKNFSNELLQRLPQNTQLVVLAGFLSILSANFIENFKGKIINIHPSLLPKYGGKGMWGHYVHKAVVLAGEKESGATVHYVSEGIDEGAIILQGKVAVLPTDTPDDVAQKVHQVEYDIFPKAITKVLAQN